jgi:CheY-like chemotaxis protein
MAGAITHAFKAGEMPVKNRTIIAIRAGRKPDQRWIFGGRLIYMADPKPKILVVDDEPEIRKLVTAMLTRHGYRVLSADTGEHAVRLANHHRDIDLLLTDVVSPGMSGPMIADEIAAIKPNIRVLFMSGYDSTQVVQRYVVEKGYSLISKPFTRDELVERVREGLAGKKTSAAG